MLQDDRPWFSLTIDRPWINLTIKLYRLSSANRRALWRLVKRFVFALVALLLL
jgi:hypothetical protein